MKTTLIFSMLSLFFSVYSQDIYFGPNIPISISDKAIFKGNLKIENANNVTFKPDANIIYNQNFDAVSGVVASEGRFSFENTAVKTVKGIFRIDTIALLTNSKINISNAVTFQANDVLELNGQITTGANQVELGKSTSNPGVLNYSAGFINGTMKRWFAPAIISNVLFPFGSANYYSPAKITYTTAPNGGSLTGKYILNSNIVYTISIMDSSEHLENLSGDGFWQIDQTDDLNSGTYSIELTTNNLDGVSDPSVLHALKRPTSSDSWGLNWTTEGLHVQSSASGSFFSVYRTGLTSFSQFGIASPIINPLPIELVFFNGLCGNNFTTLNWQTASEYNTSNYIIEKSYDGNNWIVIGSKEAAGNSTELIDYQYNDENRSDGVSYYQLKQVDNNGAFKIYGPIAVNCENSSTMLEVYPNPIETIGTINYSSTESGMLTIELSDNSGKIIEHLSLDIEKGQTIFPIDLSSKSKGVYLLKTRFKEQQMTKKIIKL
jgi:hypothetical protein